MVRKCVLLFVLIVTIVFTLTIESFADSRTNFELFFSNDSSNGHIHNYLDSLNKQTVIYEDNDTLIINSIAPCPFGNGIHDAEARGSATVILNGSLSFYGACWQCSNCYEVIGTEYDPLMFGTIGRYATVSFYEPISMYGAIMYVSSVAYTSSSTLQGYSFSH